MHVPPPGFPGGWDDLDIEVRASLIAYAQLRDEEESNDRNQISRIFAGAR